jgi:SAM-dependent methyltransferase
MKLERLTYYLPFTSYPYRGGGIECPVCDGESGKQVASLDRRFKRLPTFACGDCGLLFTNPMPTDEELANYYTNFYRLDYQGAVDTPSEKHLEKRRIEARGRIACVEPLLKSASRTLDVGCGSGEFVTDLLKLGHDALGLEPGSTYGNFARSLHGDRIQVQGWQAATYSDRFDLVSCFHVLEHLRNPLAALRQFAKWTKPNGLVYIEVPNMGESSPSKGMGALHFAHVIGFNQHNLVLAGLLSGLQPKAVVSPTAIIFEHGANVDGAREAEQGKQLTESLYANNRPLTNYVRYQLGKFWKRQR